MKRKVLILFTTLFISNIEISAQLNTTIVGDAVDQGGNCFLITNDLQSQQGGVWYDNPIDFSNDFTINYQNNFGDNDSNGADGMALVFKTTPNAVYGGAGGGIGYFSIDDSLIVEFDTFQNPAYLDPTQDHLSIMKNGNPSHNNTETNSSRSTVPRVQGQNIETTRPTVAVNSEIICSGEIAKLTATPSPIGNYVYTWVVPAGAENPGDVQSFSTSIEGDYSVSIRKEDFLCNMDFEDNQIVAPGDYIIVSQESIPCWETTASDSRIEVWGDGFSGISAYSGNQFIELNANMQSTLFQDFEVIPGSSTQISFAHRGRSYNEEDIMEVEIGPVGGPYINLGAFSDGTDAWGNYSIDFSFPIGEITLYTIRFKSIYPNSSFGNFLDNISLSFSGDSSESATGNVSIITPNSSPTFIQVDPICSGGTLNDLPIISSNGIEGTWSPGINNIATTIYTFTPASGECAISSTQMTVVVNPIITPTFPQVAAICSGETLSDLPTESTNNIQGTWSPAMNNTATTTYTFTPDGTEMCAELATLQIIVNPIITPTFPQVAAICSGETLSDLPTESTNNIQGTWSPALNNTATTTYTFTPDGTEMCAELATLQIIVNPIITPTFPQVAAICSGETLSDLPTESTNNIQGTWSPALNSTATTIYTFSPDASETCAENQSMTITVNPIITPTFTQVGAICAGETLSDLPTTSSNGVLGTWSPAINNMATITYAFSPDAGECSTSLVQMTIIVNSLVTPTFTQVGAICAGETLSDLPTTSANGVLGTWSPAMNSTATTTYTFIPDASETCAENQSMTITVNPIITPTFTQVGAVCAGETISNLPTTSANGVLGTWSPAINNIATTTYVFTPDMGECSTSLAQMTIIVNPIITPNFNQVGAICAGETLSDLPTTSANGVSGSWLPVMNNISTTTYIFTPDSGECSTGLVQMTVIVNPIITPNFNQVGAICAGEALSNLPTTSVNGVSGIWSPGMSNTATTAYTFTPDASETCAVSQSMTITVNPTITPIFYPVAAICEGELLTNLPTISMNGVSGSWLPLMNNTSTTTYVFTPDAGECSIGLVQMTIAVNPIITPIFTQVGAICVGETLSDLPTTSANGVLGTWSPAINNTATTTYTFTSDTSETCAVNQSMTITVNQTVIPVFDPVGAICEGELLTNLPTTSVNGVLGIWSPAMNNMATTTYIFTPDASEICAETTTLEIVVNEIINSNLDLRIVVNKLDYNQSVEVDVANAVGFYEYKLDGGLWQDSNLFENLIVGKHIVAAREKSGCSIESNIWFLLIDYPRFFTPNNDGVNDTWNIEGLESQPEAVITVFDRYGKTLAVFRANELGWNGVWNGKGILSNSYWFKVRYFEMEKRPKTVMSYFSLLR